MELEEIVVMRLHPNYQLTKSIKQRFLSIVLHCIVLFILIGFTAKSFVQAQTISSAESDISVDKERRLSVLTWNVYLLPWIVPWKGQCKRARAIVDVVADLEYDVIVIQEAFHNRARKILIEGLLPTYPFQIEPGKGRFLKFNSGVFIISKIPLQLIDKIKYKECKLFFQD